MTAPAWLDGAVRAFGRQMGLKNFGLGERDVAGVTFENGVSVRLEYARESLSVMAVVPCGEDASALRRFRGRVHPAAHPSVPALRAVRFARSGSGAYVVRLPERAVTVSELERVFRIVWEEAVAFARRSA